MEFICVKIGDDKRHLKATSSLIKFRQKISALIETEDFSINYCEDEFLEALDYTLVETQEEFEKALVIVKRFNRFFRVDIGSSESQIESVASPKNSEFSGKSSIDFLDVNKQGSSFSPSMVSSQHEGSESASKHSESSSIQNSFTSNINSSRNEPRFVYNNKTVYIEKILKREKKIKEKASKCQIKSQSPISIDPTPKNKIISSSTLLKCSKCKNIIKAVLTYCTDSKSYLLCSKCKSSSNYVMKSNEQQEKARCKAIITHFFKMGFTDLEKIEETLLKTNWCYSRTLSSLLGY